MICTWCNNEAVTIGRLPPSAKGKALWPACEVHRGKLTKLRLIPLSESEVRDIERDEKRLAIEARKRA